MRCRRPLAFFSLFLTLVLVGCEPQVPAPELTQVPAGPFLLGSESAEREAAYALDETAYGHSRTRQAAWYENEVERRELTTPGFFITTTPITNAQYAAFVADTGHPPPDVRPETWKQFGLVHPYARTHRHAWADGKPPEGREDHPVVLISYDDAQFYARWLTLRTGLRWRLPTAREWEKAARGTDGRRFPWGDVWQPELANTHDLGPFDTMPVGSFPEGASPYGMLDAAGQVFEWTQTLVGKELTATGQKRILVKGGGSWDDKGCGICRPAAWHPRPGNLKHILIGFRLVVDRGSR